jgi:hypothetical protein
VFLFGILSGPLPYLLMAAFYIFGFVAGAFHKESADLDSQLQNQANNIQAQAPAYTLDKAENNFHFYQFKAQKKVENCVKVTLPLPPCSKEKLIYFVHDIKIPHTSISDFYFCRPPPVHSYLG